MTGWAAVLAGGGPVPVQVQGSTHISSAFVTAVLISVPSVIIAISSYYLSVRAKRETAGAVRDQIDASAYERARVLYESAIDTLRQELADSRAQILRLNDELAAARKPPQRRPQRPRPP